VHKDFFIFNNNLTDSTHRHVSVLFQLGDSHPKGNPARAQTRTGFKSNQPFKGWIYCDHWNFLFLFVHEVKRLERHFLKGKRRE
jgi:hypothetical protein